MRRRRLRRILLVELIFVLVGCYVIYYSSTYNVMMRTIKTACDMINEDVKSCDFSSKCAARYKETMESIVEESEEYLWTTEAITYRSGPDESYGESGELETEKMVLRTGITRNEWSRIVIDEEEYYIPSDKLTDETPISALIWSGEKGEYQKYALSLFPDYGWSDKELEPLINLWNRESRWNPNAHNRSSGAHGIPQALPASKMASEGSDYYTNGNTQVRWGLKYIAGRYGSPSAAWNFFLSHNSY